MYPCVRRLVEPDAEGAEPSDDPRPHLGGVLADSARHDDRVGPADDGVVAADVERVAVGEHLERELGHAVALRGLRAYVPAVARPGEREQARLPVQQGIRLRGGEVPGLHDGEYGGGVDVAAARAHDQPGERREPHRGVHDLPVADCRERRAVAEVARDEVHPAERLLQPLRGGVRHELVARAVEAVLADAHLLVELRGYRVEGRAVRHRLVEGRIKHAHVGNTLEYLRARLDAAEVGGHVQGAELDELLRLGHRLPVHEGGVLEHLPAVQDAVADRVDALSVPAEVGHHAAQGLRVVLRAAAAYALHDPLAERLLALHVEELILEGRRPCV